MLNYWNVLNGSENPDLVISKYEKLRAYALSNVLYNDELKLKYLE